MSSRSFPGIRTALAGLVVLAVGVPVQASASGEWVRVETANFTLISDAGEEHAKAVGASVERLRDVLTQLAGAGQAGPAGAGRGRSSRRARALARRGRGMSGPEVTASSTGR